MNIVEGKTRIEKELDRRIKNANSKYPGYTEYTKGYIDGLRKAVEIMDTYLDEQIERMVKEENEIHMAEQPTDKA